MVKPVQTTYPQEMFLREYMKQGCRDAAAAYRKVYRSPRPQNAKVYACRVLKKPHVVKRLQYLQERQMKKSDITIEKILADYQWVIDAGKREGKLSDIKSAAEGQAKLVGLLRERVETGHVGEFNEMPTSEILEQIAKEQGADIAQKIAIIYGIDLEIPVETKEQKDTATLMVTAPPTDAVN